MVKVTRPIPKGVFLRERLFAKIDLLRTLPVIWISAPAGAGKTTLVSSYVTTREIPCLWYQLDQGDGDIATFFYYLGMAAHKAAPRRKKPLPLLTPEYHRGIPTFTLRYFEQLFSRLKTPSLLVFDNYQEVPDESQLHAVILQALTTVPEGINVLVISRADPPPDLIRLQANHLMEILGWEEIRLTMEEVKGIMLLREFKISSPDTMRHVYTLTNGWAAGLVLLSGVAKKEGLESRLLEKRTLDEIFAYFAHEVFEQLDGQTQEFFLKTAWLPKMTIRMAEEITGHPEAGRILHRLSRNNYFTMEHLRPEPVYEYHQLFREFLLSRAKDMLPQDILATLITDAALLLERNGQVDEAIKLIREAGDWNALSLFIIDHARSILKQGRHRSLEQWLSGIPEDVLHASPWLLFWLGMSLLPLNPPRSMGYFEEAYDQFKEINDVSGFFMAWSGMANVIAFGFSGAAKFDELIRDFEEQREAFDVLPSTEIRARVAGGMFGILALRQPEHPEAYAWAELALDLASKNGDIEAIVQNLLGRIYARLATGKLNQAADDIKSLRAIMGKQTISDMGQLVIKRSEAMLYGTALMHQQCLHAVDSGLEFARNSGIHLWDNLLICHAAMSCLNVGDDKGAAHYIMLLSQDEDEPRPWVKLFMYWVKSRNAMVRGNLEEAALCVEKGLRLSAEAALSFISCQYVIFSAQVMHRIGKDRQAEELISQAVPMIKHSNNDTSFNARFLDAEMAFDQGQDDLGLAYLRDALHKAREQGYLGPVWDIPSSTAKLLARALEAGIEVDYVKEIIRCRNLVPDDLPLTLEDWPWPIKVFTMGRFQILRDEQPIAISRKAQKKPLEMLKTLIAHGVAPVGETSIADILWPEADGDLAHQTFATTLYRLRKLLGHPEVLPFRDKHLSLDLRYCWVDAWAFERLLKNADACKQQGDLDRAGALTEKATALYRGAFLAGEPEEHWMVSSSERLRSKFLKGVRFVAQCRELEGQWEKAVECYERCLAVDDCIEEVYQCLMTCFQRLGRRDEALSVYRRCKIIFDTALGIAPSAETERLRASLLSEKTH